MEEKLTHEQKLEKRRCYFQGDVITSIEELVKYDSSLQNVPQIVHLAFLVSTTQNQVHS